MKKQKDKRECPTCGKLVPTAVPKRWFNGVNARWHEGCYETTRLKFIALTFPPRKKSSKVKVKVSTRGAKA